MQRKQFTFYRGYWEAAKKLPKKDRLAFLDAICAYIFEGTTAELTGQAAAVFTLVLPVLEASNRKAANAMLGRGKPKTNRKQEQE